MTVNPAKTAELIEMQFGMWTQLDYVFRRDPDPDTCRGNIKGENGLPRTCSDMSDS